MHNSQYNLPHDSPHKTYYLSDNAYNSLIDRALQRYYIMPLHVRIRTHGHRFAHLPQARPRNARGISDYINALILANVPSEAPPSTSPAQPTPTSATNGQHPAPGHLPPQPPCDKPQEFDEYITSYFRDTRPEYMRSAPYDPDPRPSPLNSYPQPTYPEWTNQSHRRMRMLTLQPIVISMLALVAWQYQMTHATEGRRMYGMTQHPPTTRHSAAAHALEAIGNGYITTLVEAPYNGIPAEALQERSSQ